MNLKKAKTLHLINELKARGYFTGLLFDREDIERELEIINDGEDTPIHLTDEQKNEVYKTMFESKEIWVISNQVSEQIQNTIYQISKQSK